MKPCTHCGFCCLSEHCEAANIAIGAGDSICPFLKYTDGVYSCILIEIETMSGLEPVLAKTLAIGKGCPNEEELR